jgi:hypothetical protein
MRTVYRSQGVFGAIIRSGGVAERTYRGEAASKSGAALGSGESPQSRMLARCGVAGQHTLGAAAVLLPMAGSFRVKTDGYSSERVPIMNGSRSTISSSSVCR